LDLQVATVAAERCDVAYVYFIICKLLVAHMIRET